VAIHNIVADIISIPVRAGITCCIVYRVELAVVRITGIVGVGIVILEVNGRDDEDAVIRIQLVLQP
jgi:hypothetical protein